MSTSAPPARQVLICRSAEVFALFLRQTGVSATEYCRQLDLPKRTFEAWMANRSGSRAAGHKRGPISLLRRILDETKLPHDVAEALRDVVDYVQRFLR